MDIKKESTINKPCYYCNSYLVTEIVDERNICEKCLYAMVNDFGGQTAMFILNNLNKKHND